MSALIKFNCPVCSQPIEAPWEACEQGAICPSCKTGFVPNKTAVKIVSDKTNLEKDHPLAQSQTAYDPPVPEHVRSQNNGDIIMGVANLLMVFFVFAAVAAGCAEKESGRIIAGQVAAALLIIALTLYIICQLIFIRAAIEKKK